MLLRRLPSPRKRIGKRVHTYAHARTKTISRPKYIYISRTHQRVSSARFARFAELYISQLIRESAPLATLSNVPIFKIVYSLCSVLLAWYAPQHTSPDFQLCNPSASLACLLSKPYCTEFLLLISLVCFIYFKNYLKKLLHKITPLMVVKLLSLASQLDQCEFVPHFTFNYIVQFHHIIGYLRHILKLTLETQLISIALQSYLNL